MGKNALGIKTNNMGYKMNGFSGFKSSPAKQKKDRKPRVLGDDSSMPKDKSFIGENFKKKIVYSKLGKDLKEAGNIIIDDINKLAGTKVHSGTGSEGRGRLIRGTSPQHKYWKKK